MMIPTGQLTQNIKTGFIALLFITVLFGVATPAAATPYSILIENPGVWTITGNFDSLVETWTLPSQISNWEFSIEHLTPPFTVGPLTEPTDILMDFEGSISSGITELLVNTPGNTEAIGFRKINEFFLLITFNGNTGVDSGGVFSQLNNKVNIIPEPTTVMLFVTGLAGLAAYRWSHARRERTQVR